MNSSIIIEGVRRGIAFINKSDNPADTLTASVTAAELIRLGYLVNPAELEGYDKDEVLSLVELAKEVTGADRSWEPVYKNFPEEVKNTPLIELYVNQILHYITGGAFFPESIKEDRNALPISDFRNARKLSIKEATNDSFLAVAFDIVTDPVAISQMDYDYLASIIRERGFTASELLPVYSEAKNRENAQRLVGSFDEWDRNDVVNYIKATKHVDGLLRLLLSVYGQSRTTDDYSNFDVAVNNLVDSYSNKVQLRHIPTRVRKAVVLQLGFLTRGYKADNLVAHLSLWRRVLNTIHPFQVARTTESVRALNIIFENVDYRTFASVLEEAYNEKDADKVVSLLQSNTGLLIRSAVRIARLGNVSSLAHAIEKDGSNVPLSTLISAYNGVANADSDHARVIRVAGRQNSTTTRTADKIGARNIGVLKGALKSAITDKFRDTEFDGEVIGIANGDAPVSLVSRDASAGDRVLERGSVIGEFEENDVLRIFQHWNNDAGHSGYMDGGLVATDANFSRVASSSWDDHGIWTVYSGDTCVSPGDSAVEFFDVNIAEFLKTHPTAKWIAFSIISYSSIDIASTDVYAGVSVRDADHDQDGEIWDPRTVTAGARLTNKGLDNVVLAIDVVDRKIVWLDTSSGANQGGSSATRSHEIEQVLAAEIGAERLSWSELAVIKANALGVNFDDTVDVDKEALSRAL